LALAIAGARFAGTAQRRAIGITLAAATLTPIAGFPLLTVIAERAGWRAAFALIGLLGLLATGFAAVALPGERPAGGPFRMRDLIAAYAPLLRDCPTLLLLGATATRSICWLGALTYLGTFFAERHDLGPQGLGLVYMIGGTGYFLGSVAAGGRLGRAPLRPLIAATTALMAALFGALFAAPLSAPAAIAALSGATFAYALGWVGLATLLAEGAPGGRATAQILNTSVFSLGAAAGGGLGGLLVALGDFGALGLGLPLFALAAVPLVWRPEARTTSKVRVEER
jgi:predicted MFS family arabinose efflux permease